MTRLQAEKKLVAAYRWRQRRYAHGVLGLSPHRGNCWNEQNMAREIMHLEEKVEDLGGDCHDCLTRARELEDATK